MTILCERGAKTDVAYPYDTASPLIDANYGKHLDAVKALLDFGAALNALNGDLGQRTLATAARVGGEAGEALARLLLERGAEINARSHDVWTPLMGAVLLGHVKMVAFLVAQGADVNVESVSGQTAITVAYSALALARKKKDAEKVTRTEALIELLYDAGAK